VTDRGDTSSRGRKGVTRRRFVAASSASLAASAAQAQTAPSFNKVGDTLQVVWGGDTWTIDPAVVGKTKVDLRTPSNSDRAWEITLSGPVLGTDLDLALRARIEEPVDNTWRIKLSVLGARQVTLPLTDWCAGSRATLDAPERRIKVADDGLIALPASRAVVTKDLTLFSGTSSAGLELTPSGNAPAKLSVPGYAWTAKSVTVQPRAAMPADRATIPGAALGACTDIHAVGGVGESRASPLGKVGRDDQAFASMQQTSAVRLATWKAPSGRRGVLVADGVGRLQFRAVANGEPGGELRLEKLKLSGDADELLKRITLEAVLADVRQRLESKTFSATFWRENATPVTRTWGAGPVGEMTFPIRLVAVHAPVKGASSCDLEFRETPAKLYFGDLIDPALPGSGDVISETISVLHGGVKARVRAFMGRFAKPAADDTSLERGGEKLARMRLRRTIDSFDLSFSYPGYRFELNEGGSPIMRRLSLSSLPDADLQPYRIVHFDAQHLSEEVFYYNEGGGQPGPNDARQISKSAKDALGRETWLARTQASGPSRLVFEFSGQGQSKPPTSEPISVEEVTDWTDMALRVHQRAIEADLEADAELEAGGFTRSMSRDAAKQHFAGLLRSPDAGETSLELVTGLLFSPDRHGRFLTPAHMPRPQLVNPNWGAVLDPSTRTAVRVLSSVDFDPKILTIGGARDYEKENSAWINERFHLPINRRQRREIFMESSAIGLPGLRAVDPNGMDKQGGMVRRPKSNWYLSDKTDVVPGTANTKFFKEGVISPRPFATADIMLTSRGATTNLIWAGEPPATQIAGIVPFIDPAAFNVEKAVMRTVGGRDAYVMIQEKGFLFPIGFRVSLISLTQRMRRPSRDNAEKKDPVFYLSKRHFIIPKIPKKAFPASQQPFKGRDYPAKAVELLTQRTPDLVKDVELDVGARGVFWPRTAPGTQPHPAPSGHKYGNEVRFEYRVDGDKTRVTAPLIFVSNEAAHTPAAMKKLTAYYNALPVPASHRDPETQFTRLRLESHSDRDALFAPSKKAGDTQFKARQVRLGARGRLINESRGGPQENFDVTIFMEGLDEPPFHPTMVDAKVTIQPLDRLLGRAQGPVTVAYDEDYVRHGFDSSKNPSEIFLRVVGPVIGLDVGAQGKATGGVAKPSAKLAALSRSVGFVGGRELPSPSGQSAVTDLIADADIDAPATVGGSSVGSPAPKAFDYRSAKAGMRNPAEYFHNATLLGIVPLDLILKVASITTSAKTKELADYGGKAVDDALRAAGQIAAALKEFQRQAQASLDKAIQQVLDPEGKPTAFTLEALYPDLMDQYARTIRASEACAAAAASNVERERKLAAATGMYDAGQGLLREVEEVLRHPVPVVLTQAIADAQQLVQNIRRLAANPRALLADKLQEWIETGPIGEFLDQAIDADLFQPLFGPLVITEPAAPNALPGAPGGGANTASLPQPRPGADPAASRAAQKKLVRQLLKNPHDALPQLQQSLFFERFGRPLAEALDAAARLRGVAETRLEWSRDELAGQIVNALRQLPGVGEAVHPAVAEFAAQVVALIDARLTRAARDGRLDLQQELVGLRQDVAATGGPLETLRNRLAADLLVLVEQTASSSVDAARDLEAKLQIAKPADRARLKAQLDAARLAIAAQALRGVNLPAQLYELQSALGGAKAEVERTRLALQIQQLDALLVQAQRFEGALRALSTLRPQVVADAAQAMVKARLEKALEDIKSRIAEQVDASIGAALRELVTAAEKAFSAVQAGGLMALAARAGSALGATWCAAATDKLPQIAELARSVAFDTLGSAGELEKPLADAASILDRIDLPASVRSGNADRYRVQLQATKTALQRVAAELEALQRLRFSLSPGRAPGQLGDKLSSVCTAPGAFASAVGDAIQKRRELADRLARLVRDTVALYEALRLIPEAARPNVSELSTAEKARIAGEILAALGFQRSLLELASSLRAIRDPTIWNARIRRAITSLETAIGAATAKADLKAVADAVATRYAEALRLANAAVGDLAQDGQRQALLRLATELEGMKAEVERDVIAAILQTVLLPGQLPDKLEAGVRDLLRQAVTPTLELHESALKGVSALSALLKKPSSSEESLSAASVLEALGAPTIDALKKAEDAITKDRDLLSDIAKALNTTGGTVPWAPLNALRNQWRTEGLGLVRAAELLAELVSALGRGQISALISFDGVERLLRDKLLELLPVRVRVQYDFDTELSPFPSSDPVFAMDPSVPAEPLGSDPAPPENDLVLKSRVEINLLTGKRSVTASGRLKPFKVHLLGGAFDLLSIQFKGARFDLDAQGRTELKADIHGVQYGALLSFIEPLQKLMSPEEGNGFYLAPSYAPIGIEAGYRYASPLIMVGSLQLINLAISAAVLLPFSEGQALFKFAFASREKPFLIAQPPYGGGGFVGLTADARGIVAFEIQFEFGAVTAIKFGPLNASGRVTAGIYLLSQANGGRRIEGFVHAVGEGHVACFGVCVNIEVRVVQTESDMYGTSTVSFSFKVGFAEFRYSATAQYKVKGGSGGGARRDQSASAGLAAHDVTRYALDAVAQAPDASLTERLDRSAAPFIRRDVRDKHRAWRDYRKHLALKAYKDSRKKVDA